MRFRLGAPDRRRLSRGAPFGEPSRRDLTTVILNWYREKPDLTLDVSEASHLLNVRVETSKAVLRDLSRAGRLRRARDGRYTAPDSFAESATYSTGGRSNGRRWRLR